MPKLHLVVVTLFIPFRARTVAQAIRHAQAPRYLRKQIPIIGCCIFLFFLFFLRGFWFYNLPRQRIHRRFYDFLLFLLALVLIIALKPTLYYIIVEGVTKTGAGAKEVWEATVIPVQLIATNMITAGSCGVHIWVKLSAQIDGVIHFRNLDAQVHREVLPVHGIRDEVIATADTEVINDAIHLIRFLACGIFVVAQFHL